MKTGRRNLRGSRFGPLWTLAISAAFTGAVVGCDSNPTATADHSTHPVAEIAVTPATLALEVGDVVTLNASAKCEHGVVLNTPLHWATNASTVATVDTIGMVTAKAFGDATITASSGGIAAETQVSVAPQGTVITASGGTVTVGDLTLVIPANAVDEPTDVIVKALDDSAYTDDPMYVAGTTYDIQPAGLGLNSAATLSLNYSHEDLPGQMLEQRLRIKMRQQQQTTWQETLQSQVDSENNVVTAQMNKFGTVGMMGRDPTDLPVVAVTIAPASLDIGLGQTGQFEAQALDDEGLPLDRAITWTSSAPTIVVVNNAGEVTGIAEGESMITAEAGGVSASAPVTVAGTVATITVTPADFAVTEGDTQQLAAEARDADDRVLARTFTWTSSDKAVATVDENGLVTAKAPGSTTISAAADGITGSSAGQIDPRIVAITVSPATLSVVEDDTVQLTAVAVDARGDPVETDFTWSTSDPAIATVSSTGLLVAVATGDVSVSASAGGQQGSSNASVGRRITSVTVTPSPATVTEDMTVQLSAVALDKQGDPTNVTFSWTSANPSIAVVNSSGLVTGVLAGVTTVSATANGTEGSTTVTVTPKAASLTITGGSGNQPLEIGLTRQLTATAYDANGGVVTVPITWASSNENILTVDQTGLVTAVTSGTASISASAGAVSASLDIMVVGESEVGSGNNLSWPVVFADGIGPTGSTVAADPGVRPSTSETASAELLAADSTNPAVSNPAAAFFWTGNAVDETGYYLQNTGNTWRAQIVDGTGQDRYDASAAWGDNLAGGSARLRVDHPLRVEVALSMTDGNTLLGFNMPYVANPSSPDEIQGTDGTTIALVPLIYVVGPTLTIEQLSGPGGDVVATVMSETFTSEVNVGGRLIYGGQFRPSVAGTYRLRFILPATANARITEVSNASATIVSPLETALEIQVTE